MIIYTLSKKAIVETFAGEALVLALPDRHVFELNSTAVDIINLLNGERTLEQVANEMIEAYKVADKAEGNQILKDISDLASELFTLGILEIASKTG